MLSGMSEIQSKTFSNLKSVMMILYEINETSKKILKKSLEIINFIPTDYADEVLYKFPDLKRSEVIDKMMDTSSEWTQTAEIVSKDIPTLFENTESSISINFDNSSFFAEVWNGDAYDKSEVEALKMLQKELATTLQSISRNALFSKFKQS